MSTPTEPSLVPVRPGRRRHLAAGLVALSLLTVAACSSDDSSEKATHTGRPTSSASASPSASPSVSTDKAVARVQKALDEWAAANPAVARTGGIAAAVVEGPDGTPKVAAAGHAGTATLSGNEWFHQGSVTKTYVATALLELAEDGKVDLDAPVSRYVKGVQRGDSTTVRAVLNQTSGYGDYIATDAWREAMQSQPTRRWKPRELLTLVPAKGTTIGTYAYSNTNYLVAGLVLESVTGKPYGEAVRELVLEPLGLTDTDTTGEGHPVVQATIGVDDTTYVTTTELGSYTALESSSYAAGSMASTPADLARFGAALSAGRLLTDESHRQMRAVGPEGYGLGYADFAKVTKGSLQGFGNLGEIPGYAALTLVDPKSGLSLAVMTNDDHVDLAEIGPTLQAAINATG